MKRSIVCIIIAISICAICALTLSSCSNTISQEELADECVRIHIRANSASEEDQAVKLKVRDDITAYLQTRLENCTDKTEAMSVLESEQQTLVQIADNALYRNGFAYKTSIALKREYFPDRQYDGYDFPEGYYDALIIYLGEGTGENWWCVAFPPLCFVPGGQNGEKVVYKSWVKEWLDKTFS